MRKKNCTEIKIELIRHVKKYLEYRGLVVEKKIFAGSEVWRINYFIALLNGQSEAIPPIQNPKSKIQNLLIENKLWSMELQIYHHL